VGKFEHSNISAKNMMPNILKHKLCDKKTQAADVVVDVVSLKSIVYHAVLYRDIKNEVVIKTQAIALIGKIL
jgi:hypothetical protein